MAEKTLKNAKQLPKIYYGLHMAEGVCEYDEKPNPERVFIGEETIKAMNPSFAGLPVYAYHVPAVDLEKMEEEAVGYVSESFFNPLDGKYWAKFIVVSDKGHEALAHGWKLSNAYAILESGPGGKWHNVDYDREVLKGEFRHLAIVQNPRYSESIVLTPEQFKEYNFKKEQELKTLTNSKEDKSMLKKFFKKAKVENAEEIESTVVVLANGVEKTIGDLITEANKANETQKENEAAPEKAAKPDAAERPEKAKDEAIRPESEKAEKADSADDVMSKKIKVGEEEMTVNELVEKYQAMHKANAEAAADREKKEEKKDEAEEGKKEEKKEEGEKKNAAPQKDFFTELQNAPFKPIAEAPTVDLSQMDRGKARYGSDK